MRINQKLCYVVKNHTETKMNSSNRLYQYLSTATGAFLIESCHSLIKETRFCSIVVHGNSWHALCVAVTFTSTINQQFKLFPNNER